jgi:iron(II)-dependent oxidoreductase
MVVDLHREAPQIWDPVIRHLLARLDQSSHSVSIIQGVIEGSSSSSRSGALLVARSGIPLSPHMTGRVKDIVLQILLQDALPPLERKDAGYVLSQLGDPRDLEELVGVEGGIFVLGSDAHVNSRPKGLVAIERYRIGVYPVVNRDYARFVEETGRQWTSADGKEEGRRNVPATDVTWHDAIAYCLWVTHRWREAGKIQLNEHVRLPTEVEWERAARGDLKESGNGDPVWPWGSVWLDDTANFEETGFNEPCAVGLFPKGRSPYGCYDMAGQVWEWCSTLWGEDMSKPSLQYPYRVDDGREDQDAPDRFRRVLRGGCFSSGRLKVSSDYRGSLEPTGFWRGNGFRVVVARGRD